MSDKVIYQKIADIAQEIEAIGKTKRNDAQGYQYRGIDDIMNSIQPLFAKHRVFITSNVISCEREERQSKSGAILIWTNLNIEFQFTADDGSIVCVTMRGEGMDSGDKSTNKAHSAALKYALMEMFLIPTEAHDADADTPPPVEKKTRGNIKKLESAIAAATEKDMEKIKQMVGTREWTPDEKEKIKEMIVAREAALKNSK